MEIISSEEKIRRLGERLKTDNAETCLDELKSIIESESGELDKAEVS
ncbi:MAG: hypothetical protein R6U37_08925 [Dehalococcoidia bacterium]